MRAIFESEIRIPQNGETIIIRDDSFHHLSNVVRSRVGDEVKVFNGKGLELQTKIQVIEKKQLSLKVESVISHPRPELLIDVLLGTPKKDALELCLKQVVELGVNRLYLAATQYSQKVSITPERELSLLVSGLEQSNNPFLPEITPVESQQIATSDYEQILIFDSVNKGVSDFKQMKGKILIVIGPEGGFSDSELAFWKALPQTVSVHLPIPIMRTPTALSCAIGFTLGKLN